MNKRQNRFSPEVRSRAVRMVLDHQSDYPSRWSAISSISSKIGCTPSSLYEWIKKAEIETGQRAGVPSDVSEKLKSLEREVRELRQANEILRKAPVKARGAYFAMPFTKIEGLDRPDKEGSDDDFFYRTAQRNPRGKHRELGRYADFCLLPRQPFISIWRAVVIPNGCRFGHGVTVF